MFRFLNTRGFTLIELLVVIAIISLLSSVVLSNVNSSKVRARDAKRKTELRQMFLAAELYRNDYNQYPASAGYTGNWNPTSNPLVPAYIFSLSVDPTGSGGGYQYWRKDYAGYTCMTLNDASKFAFYAKLESPSASDLATLADSFDQCCLTKWGMNYKVGN